MRGVVGPKATRPTGEPMGLADFERQNWISSGSWSSGTARRSRPSSRSKRRRRRPSQRRKPSRRRCRSSRWRASLRRLSRPRRSPCSCRSTRRSSGSRPEVRERKRSRWRQNQRWTSSYETPVNTPGRERGTEPFVRTRQNPRPPRYRSLKHTVAPGCGCGQTNSVNRSKWKKKRPGRWCPSRLGKSEDQPIRQRSLLLSGPWRRKPGDGRPDGDGCWGCHRSQDPLRPRRTGSRQARNRHRCGACRGE